MYINNETIDFLQFIGIGVLLALIFDIFRAHRIYKKVDRNMALLQDIIYFVIAWLVIIIALLKLLTGNIRLYLFIGILIGFLMYFSTFSKYMIKLNLKIFKLNNKFIAYIFLPLKFNIELIEKIYEILSKFLKKCCKKFLNVIFSIYGFLKIQILKMFSNFVKRTKNINKSKAKKNNTPKIKIKKIKDKTKENSKINLGKKILKNKRG